MLRYAISDRTLFAGDESSRQAQLMQQVLTLGREGVDYFQLREKDLHPEALLALATTLRDAIRSMGTPMRLILNGPLQLALRAGIAWHGAATQHADGELSMSCSVHALEEVEQQRSRTQLLLFAPVFEKTVAGQTVQGGTGLEQLSVAVQHARGTPVLALGGVTPGNAPLCMAAGAAGIAGIRLFQRESTHSRLTALLP